MDQLNRSGVISNVNVTLESKREENSFAGMQFPCCVCLGALEIKITKRGKPCCTCNQCGIQIFFRGKIGITRLKALLNSGKLTFGNKIERLPGIILFNEIEQIRSQKGELEAKQGFIIKDSDLTNAILAVDNELERKQIELAKMTEKAVRRKAR
jgi:hypothetical protein